MITPPDQPRFSRWLEWAIGFAGWSIILTIAATSVAPLTYDEPPYLAPVAAFQRYGLSFALLSNYPEVSGIVHTAVQWAVSPWTHLAIPGVRLVNPFIVLLDLAAVAWLLTIVAPGTSTFSLRLLALPPVWVVTGLALTELPALGLLALSLAVFFGSRKHAMAAGLILAAAAGVLFSGAVLGKQTVLAIAGGLAWLGWQRAEWRPHVVAFGLSAMLCLLPIFWAWGGMAPPGVKLLQQGSWFSLTHTIYAFAYAALFASLLAHGFFAGRLRTMWPYLAALAILNLAFNVIVFRPFASGVTRILSDTALMVYDRLSGGLLIAFAALFCATLVSRMREHRDDLIWRAAAVSVLLGLLSLGAVTYSFSSRYLVPLSPLLLIVLLPYRRSDRLSTALLIGGHAVGAISLLAYHGYFSR